MDAVQKTLTQGDPAYPFNAQIRSTHLFGTSGSMDGGSFKFQQRNSPDEAWVDNPNYTGAADTHLAGTLTIVCTFNRLLLVSPGASAEVNVRHDAGQ